MAWYKHPQFLEQNSDVQFDRLYNPGDVTPIPGIYRCEVCGLEITHTTTAQTLPPQNHHQHPQRQPIQWRLIVWPKTTLQ